MSGFAVFLLVAMAAVAPGRVVLGQVIAGQFEPAPDDPLEALARARSAAERAPSEFAPALAVAQALTAVGRTEDALAAFARARSLSGDPGHAETVDTVNVELAYLAPALLLRDLDRTGEAIRLLEEAVAREIGSADVYEQLALIRLADGLAAEALAAVDAALAEGLKTPGLELARGLALARDPESRGEALEALRRALDDGVGEPVVVHLEAADLLSAMARYPEALEHLRAAAALAAGEPEVAYRLGRTLAAAGDREGAQAALERYRALRDAGDRAAEKARAASSEVASGLSEAQRLAAEGELEAALDRLAGLLESHADHPRTADMLSLRAKVLFSIGRTGEAAASIAEARALQPDRVEHHYLEGLFLHTDGRAGEAAPALERALALDPNLGEAHALLGMIAAEAGRPAEAAERMERALALGLDGNAALRFNYARVLESLGRGGEAVAQMEAFERLRAAPPR